MALRTNGFCFKLITLLFSHTKLLHGFRLIRMQSYGLHLQYLYGAFLRLLYIEKDLLGMFFKKFSFVFQWKKNR